MRDAVAHHASVLPDLNEILAALWVRSISVGNQPGADARTLQVDCTRAKPLDNNLFASEMLTIVENSFNIHQQGGVYQFKEEENPRARIMATARNDRQFTDGRDLQHLAKEVRYVFAGGDQVAKGWRVVVLPREWDTDPWSKLEPENQPAAWKDGRFALYKGWTIARSRSLITLSPAQQSLSNATSNRIQWILGITRKGSERKRSGRIDWLRPKNSEECSNA